MRRCYYRKRSGSIITPFIFLSWPIYIFFNLNGVFVYAGSIISLILILILLKYIKQYIKNLKNKITEKTYISASISKVDTMEGIEFERFLLAHFKRLGFDCTMTPPNKDFGADLILHKDSHKIVVQAKRWNTNAGIKSVQEAIGGMLHHKADKAIVITNRSFTKSAIIQAKSANVELWDRSRVLQLIEKEKIDLEVEPQQEKKCPLCDSELLYKRGKHGMFVGCSNFPKCRFTKNTL